MNIVCEIVENRMDIYVITGQDVIEGNSIKSLGSNNVVFMGSPEFPVIGLSFREEGYVVNGQDFRDLRGLLGEELWEKCKGEIEERALIQVERRSYSVNRDLYRCYYIEEINKFFAKR